MDRMTSVRCCSKILAPFFCRTPGLEQCCVRGAFQERPPVAQVLIEAPEDGVSRRERLGPVRLAAHRPDVERAVLESRPNPEKHLGEVAPKLTQGHGPRVRLPVELAVREAVEHFPRHRTLLIELGKKTLG
jgi:hypothetical protein